MSLTSTPENFSGNVDPTMPDLYRARNDIGNIVLKPISATVIYPPYMGPGMREMTFYNCSHSVEIMHNGEVTEAELWRNEPFAGNVSAARWMNSATGVALEGVDTFGSNSAEDPRRWDTMLSKSGAERQVLSVTRTQLDPVTQHAIKWWSEIVAVDLDESGRMTDAALNNPTLVAHSPEGTKDFFGRRITTGALAGKTVILTRPKQHGPSKYGGEGMIGFTVVDYIEDIPDALREHFDNADPNKLIQGLEEPDKGKQWFGGHNLEETNVPDVYLLHYHIGYEQPAMAEAGVPIKHYEERFVLVRFDAEQGSLSPCSPKVEMGKAAHFIPVPRHKFSHAMLYFPGTLIVQDGVVKGKGGVGDAALAEMRWQVHPGDLLMFGYMMEQAASAAIQLTAAEE